MDLWLAEHRDDYNIIERLKDLDFTIEKKENTNKIIIYDDYKDEVAVFDLDCKTIDIFLDESNKIKLFGIIIDIFKKLRWQYE